MGNTAELAIDENDFPVYLADGTQLGTTFAPIKPDEVKEPQHSWVAWRIKVNDLAMGIAFGREVDAMLGIKAILELGIQNIEELRKRKQDVIRAVGLAMQW